MPTSTEAAHANHCFVAIPSGQTPEEHMFFEGWLNEVIRPALKDVGDLHVEVAAASTEPTSITRGIFEHLLFDGLAVFDLAGVTPDAWANPNVMYELGIRHAFRKPSVILAWEHQRLPFDVGDQRAVKIDRISFHFKVAREKITQFAKAALHDQKFYDPLAAFGLRAIVEAATTDKDALSAITSRMEELSDNVGTLRRQFDELSAVALRATVLTPPIYTTASTGPTSILPGRSTVIFPGGSTGLPTSANYYDGARTILPNILEQLAEEQQKSTSADKDKKSPKK